jgi:hypothetical protein
LNVSGTKYTAPNMSAQLNLAYDSAQEISSDDEKFDADAGGDPTKFTYVYQESKHTDLVIKSNDGFAFYVSKYMISLASTVLSAALDNDCPEIDMDYTGIQINMWLDTFHPNPNGIYLSPLDLHLIMPMAFKYDMSELMERCDDAIDAMHNKKNTHITFKLAKTIINNENFHHHLGKLGALIRSKKLTPEQVNQIPSWILYDYITHPPKYRKDASKGDYGRPRNKATPSGKPSNITRRTFSRQQVLVELSQGGLI